MGKKLSYAMLRDIACGMRELADCDPAHMRGYVTCTGLLERAVPQGYVRVSRMAKNVARNAEMVRLRGEGRTLRELSALFGLTFERIRQLTGQHVYHNVCCICDGEIGESDHPASIHAKRCHGLRANYGIEEGRRRYLLLTQRDERKANGECRCYLCKEWKPRCEFYGKTEIPKRAYCKPCARLRQRTYYDRKRRVHAQGTSTEVSTGAVQVSG